MHIAGFCVSTHLGEKVIFLRLLVIALLEFRKVVERVSNQNTSEGVGLLCVGPAIVIMVFNLYKYSLYCLTAFYLGACRMDNKLVFRKKVNKKDSSILY